MSAQCPRNIRTMSALCPHNISRRIYVGTMSALYPSSVFSSGIYVRTISFFGFHLWLIPRAKSVHQRHNSLPPPAGPCWSIATCRSSMPPTSSSPLLFPPLYYVISANNELPIRASPKRKQDSAFMKSGKKCFHILVIHELFWYCSFLNCSEAFNNTYIYIYGLQYNTTILQYKRDLQREEVENRDATQLEIGILKPWI